MDKIPEIIFVNSPRSEKARLQFTRRVIAQGFYQRHGFVVLPRLDGGVAPNAQVIYVQDLGYTQVDTKPYEKVWSRVEATFWQELERYFPGVSMAMSAIEVRITKYGTVSSSGVLGIMHGKKNVFYLRSDADISNLAAMIINAVLYGERKGLGITWTKREALMDFIMTRPVMKRLFPKFRPVMSVLARVPAVVRKASAHYLEELGLRSNEKEIEIVEGRIIVQGKVVGHEMTKLERKVLQALVEHMGELVSYDVLADTVWGVGEFKTFWALNKLVERLRQKVERMGVGKGRIKAVRGQGYILV